MPDLQFEWDARKNAANTRKHGVSFEEARTVFFDDQALLIDDPDHSNGEQRFILLGLSGGLQILAVCHCDRQLGGVIRIISPRRANRSEREQYQTRWMR